MANRLASATSPYLLQHAGNPVDWWEWSPEAFEDARRRDVPVLLSVGYAACHWCHVMAHESFEDEATAAYMNEHYVNVKVDREERPDVDAVYMAATTAMTGQGGWPMTVVLTPDGEPFFAGTYFPDRPRQGQPAFRQVLEALADAWANRREEVGTVAADVSEHLRQEVALSGEEPLDEDLLAGAVRSLATDFDATAGGFGGAPKFPPSMVLEFLLRHTARTGVPNASGMADRTLRAMARAIAGRPAPPVIEARPRDAEQAAGHGDRSAGLLRRDEPVDAHRVSVSVAKKAAARLSRSRSIRSRWFSRSSSASRTRSSDDSPSRSPTSTACCRFHLRNDSGATPISPAIVTIDRPLRRYNSTASRLNCGGYGRRPLLLPATMDILRPGPDGPSAQVSVKAGALQSRLRRHLYLD